MVISHLSVLRQTIHTFRSPVELCCAANHPGLVSRHMVGLIHETFNLTYATVSTREDMLYLLWPSLFMADTALADTQTYLRLTSAQISR